MEDTKELIRRYITTHLLKSIDTTALDYEDELISEGVIDSLGIIELVGFLEETFGVVIANQHLISKNFESISTIANLVSTLKQAPSN